MQVVSTATDAILEEARHILDQLGKDTFIKVPVSAAGLPAVHEALLAPGCRIDYLVGGVGVEIKKGRPDPAALRRQLDRYAACQGVEALVVLHRGALFEWRIYQGGFDLPQLGRRMAGRLLRGLYYAE